MNDAGRPPPRESEDPELATDEVAPEGGAALQRGLGLALLVSLALPWDDGGASTLTALTRSLARTRHLAFTELWTGSVDWGALLSYCVALALLAQCLLCARCLAPQRWRRTRAGRALPPLALASLCAGVIAWSSERNGLDQGAWLAFVIILLLLPAVLAGASALTILRGERIPPSARWTALWGLLPALPFLIIDGGLGSWLALAAAALTTWTTLGPDAERAPAQESVEQR